MIKFSRFQDREMMMEKEKNLQKTNPKLHYHPTVSWRNTREKKAFIRTSERVRETDRENRDDAWQTAIYGVRDDVSGEKSTTSKGRGSSCQWQHWTPPPEREMQCNSTQQKQHACSTCSDSDNAAEARVAVQHIVSQPEMVCARESMLWCTRSRRTRAKRQMDITTTGRLGMG